MVWVFLLILPFLVPHIARLYSFARFYAGFCPVPISKRGEVTITTEKASRTGTLGWADCPLVGRDPKPMRGA